jgi:hypothetical protein
MRIHKLHERTSQDLDVELLWNEESDAVLVKVRDRHTGEIFFVAPGRAHALDAFYHPFCYDAAPILDVADRLAA